MSLKQTVRKFFDLLDQTNMSDSGRVYHPAQFVCSDTITLMELNKLLRDMKRQSRTHDVTEGGNNDTDRETRLDPAV